jgi:O-glycosyl hydrolase
MAKKPFSAPVTRRTVLATGIAAIPVAIGLVNVPEVAVAADPRGFLIDPHQRHQVIRGFGGMTHTAWIGDLTPAQRNTAFDNGGDDLGLTILRIPVPEDRANWDIDLETAKTVAAKGALVFASPWNPPADMVELFERDVVPQGSKYQAENGTLVGAHSSTSVPGYEGTGYVQFDANSGASVQLDSVFIGSAGTKNLAFRYCSPGRDTHLDVTVAGTLVARNELFAATATDDWEWHSIQVAMTPGQWSVVLETTGDGGPALDELMAAPYTPPTQSQRLRYDAYGAYAQHLNDFVHHLRVNGVDLYGISVQNEPDYAYQWTWWTPAEMTRFLRDYAGSIDARILAPESFQYVKSQSDPILEDPAALANLDILGAHLYGTQYSDFPYPLYEEKGAGKELWMTEVYYPNSSSSANLWPEALQVAEHVHHAMADAEFQAYVWWYIRRGYGPILEDGTISKRGYMLAHFTKFIRPGATRIEAPKEAQAGVLTSAYAGEDGRLIVVAVNTTADPVSQPVAVHGRVVRRVQSWVTDASRNLEQQPGISGRGTSFVASLPPQSVTTFVVG